MKRRSLLRQLTETPLATPCDVPWDDMTGGDRQRRCAACDRDVWNLSAMTPREAEVRLLNAPHTPCINYRVDGAGRLVSRVDARAPSLRLGIGAAAFVATTLVAPGHASLGGRVAAAADKAAPPGDTPPPKTPKKKPDKPDKDDCPVAPTPPGTAALDPPQRLGGAPPPPRERPPSGTVKLQSATPRQVVIEGVTFSAPGELALPPGKHEAQISDGTKTTRRSFVVKADRTVVVDLDR
jgi:hypothetical protein